MTKKIWVGLFLILVILTSSVYILLPDKVRIDVEKTKTTFKVYENGSWVLAGTEYTVLYDGTTKMRAKERFINYTVDGSQTTIIRAGKFKENITAIDTYVFDGSTKDTELYPISHNIQVLKGEGKILHYEVKDLFYTGETINDVSSPQSFGHNMKVEWESGNYYSKIYKYKDKDEGKLTVRYRINSSDFSKNVRLFDPPIWEKVNKDTVFVKLIENKAGLTKGEAIFEINNPFDVQVNLSKYLNFEFIQVKGNINSFEVFMNYSESYQVPVYGTIIEYKNCTVFNNETGQNETIECNEEKSYVDHYETKYQESWKKAGLVEKGKHKIKLIGHWTASTRGVAIDWIPKLTFEKELYSLPNDIVLRKPEWAWWNNSWINKKQFNITASNGQIIYINLSYANVSKAQADFDDIRFLNSAEDTEFGYYLESKVDSSWAVFRIKTLGAVSMYIYYNNSAASTTSDIANVYGSDLRAVWLLDETSGTNASDSYNEHHGVLVNMENEDWQGSGIKKGLDFDGNLGSNEYVNFDNHPDYNVNTSGWTVSVWAYSETWGTSADDRGEILFYFDFIDGSNDLGWLVDFYSDPSVRCRMQTEFALYTDDISGAWHHFVGLYNGTHGKFYVDTILNASVVQSPAVQPTVPLTMGGWILNDFFDGKIDEAMIWHKELNTTEIGWMYNVTEPDYVLGTEAAPPIVTLNTPVNTANLTSLPVTFNCTAYDDLNLINVSLYIDGVLNETNTSGINNTNYIFSKNLSSGDHNWTCDAYDNENFHGTTDTWTFNIALNITGWVKDDVGNFLSGARVWVINQSDNITVGNVFTNATGYWTFGPVDAGNYYVTGYDPTNSSRDGDAAPFIVVP